MSENVSEYLILDYIDELEEAIDSAKRNELMDIHKGLNSLHGDFVELGNMADSDDKIKRFKSDVEPPLKELVESCQAGEDGKARGSMRVLRDKVHTLKAIWSK